MFNAAVFGQSVRKNYKLWIILTVVVCFFACMVAFLANANPDFNLPGSVGGDLITVYAGAFYGMMGLVLFLVYTITVGTRSVVSEVDRGDLSCTLNTPVNRREVIFTKAIFYILSVILMVVALGVVGTAANALISPGKLDYGLFWKINLVMFWFLFAVSGLSFAASCWFDKTGSALTFGAGLPIAFFLFHTIAGLGEELKFFKYLSLNTLFDPSGIIAGNGFTKEVLLLLGIGATLYTVGIVKFLRKDLPL